VVTNTNAISNIDVLTVWAGRNTAAPALITLSRYEEEEVSGLCPWGKLFDEV
jgi:hypothetical protein